MPDSRANASQPNTSNSNAQVLLIQTLIFKSLSSTEIANSVRPCCGLVILPGGHQQTPSYGPWSLCNPFPPVLSCLRQLIQTFGWESWDSWEIPSKSLNAQWLKLMGICLCPQSLFWFREHIPPWPLAQVYFVLYFGIRSWLLSSDYVCSLLSQEMQVCSPTLINEFNK